METSKADKLAAAKKKVGEYDSLYYSKDVIQFGFLAEAVSAKVRGKKPIYDTTER